jgi:hypothetical protein
VPGQPLCATSVQKVYTRCKHKAGVNKIGGIHALRHYSACRIMPNLVVSAGEALAW